MKLEYKLIEGFGHNKKSKKKWKKVGKNLKKTGTAIKKGKFKKAGTSLLKSATSIPIVGNLAKGALNLVGIKILQGKARKKKLKGIFKNSKDAGRWSAYHMNMQNEIWGNNSEYAIPFEYNAAQNVANELNQNNSSNDCDFFPGDTEANCGGQLSEQTHSISYTPLGTISKFSNQSEGFVGFRETLINKNPDIIYNQNIKSTNPSTMPGTWNDSRSLQQIKRNIKRATDRYKVKVYNPTASAREKTYKALEESYTATKYIEEVFKTCAGGLSSMTDKIDPTDTLPYDEEIDSENVIPMKCSELEGHFNHVTSVADPNHPIDSEEPAVRKWAYKNSNDYLYYFDSINGLRRGRNTYKYYKSQIIDAKNKIGTRSSSINPTTTTDCSVELDTLEKRTVILNLCLRTKRLFAAMNLRAIDRLDIDDNQTIDQFVFSRNTLSTFPYGEWIKPEFFSLNTTSFADIENCDTYPTNYPVQALLDGDEEAMACIASGWEGERCVEYTDKIKVNATVDNDDNDVLREDQIIKSLAKDSGKCKNSISANLVRDEGEHMPTNFNRQISSIEKELWIVDHVFESALSWYKTTLFSLILDKTFSDGFTPQQLETTYTPIWDIETLYEWNQDSNNGGNYIITDVNKDYITLYDDVKLININSENNVSVTYFNESFSTIQNDDGKTITRSNVYNPLIDPREWPFGSPEFIYLLSGRNYLTDIGNEEPETDRIYPKGSLADWSVLIKFMEEQHKDMFDSINIDTNDSQYANRTTKELIDIMLRPKAYLIANLIMSGKTYKLSVNNNLNTPPNKQILYYDNDNGTISRDAYNMFTLQENFDYNLLYNRMLNSIGSYMPKTKHPNDSNAIFNETQTFYVRFIFQSYILNIYKGLMLTTYNYDNTITTNNNITSVASGIASRVAGTLFGENNEGFTTKREGFKEGATSIDRDGERRSPGITVQTLFDDTFGIQRRARRGGIKTRAIFGDSKKPFLESVRKNNWLEFAINSVSYSIIVMIIGIVGANIRLISEDKGKTGNGNSSLQNSILKTFNHSIHAEKDLRLDESRPKKGDKGVRLWCQWCSTQAQLQILLSAWPSKIMDKNNYDARHMFKTIFTSLSQTKQSWSKTYFLPILIIAIIYLQIPLAIALCAGFKTSIVAAGTHGFIYWSGLMVLIPYILSTGIFEPGRFAGATSTNKRNILTKERYKEYINKLVENFGNGLSVDSSSDYEEPKHQLLSVRTKTIQGENSVIKTNVPLREYMTTSNSEAKTVNLNDKTEIYQNEGDPPNNLDGSFYGKTNSEGKITTPPSFGARASALTPTDLVIMDTNNSFLNLLKLVDNDDISTTIQQDYEKEHYVGDSNLVGRLLEISYTASVSGETYNNTEAKNNFNGEDIDLDMRDTLKNKVVLMVPDSASGRYYIYEVKIHNILIDDYAKTSPGGGDWAEHWAEHY